MTSGAIFGCSVTSHCHSPVAALAAIVSLSIRAEVMLSVNVEAYMTTGRAPLNRVYLPWNSGSSFGQPVSTTLKKPRSR